MSLQVQKATQPQQMNINRNTFLERNKNLTNPNESASDEQLVAMKAIVTMSLDGTLPLK